jgi:2-keto-4-pentenoate hydratase
MAQQAGIQLTPQVIQADQQQKQIQQTNQLANEAAIKGAYASQKGNQPSNSQ